MKKKLQKQTGKFLQGTALKAVYGMGLLVVATGLTACNSIGPFFLNKKEIVSTTPIENKVEYGVPLSGVDIFQNAEAELNNGEAQLDRKAGRVFVGKPYKINGQWFYPEVDVGYSKVGRASWYGPSFHGRKTANGEIFDMNHLTAAHPTMPLPSYARVTNLQNGSSIVVRVNDRGPFANNRLIDLSKKVAEKLDFVARGVVDVKVEYIGPAPAQPKNDSYLLASYRGPDESIVSASAFADIDNSQKTEGVSKVVNGAVSDGVELSEARPVFSLTPRLTSAYVDEYVSSNRDSDVFARILRDSAGVATANQEYIALGSFIDGQDLQRIAEKLKSFGSIKFVKDNDRQGNVVYSAQLAVKHNIDDALEAAWQAGAVDAFIVRDN